MVYNLPYTNFIETTNQGHKMIQQLINQFTQALAAYDRAELKHLYKSLTEDQAIELSKIMEGK
jgi:hypothetical protein